MRELRAFQHNMFNLPSIKEMYSAGADLHGFGEGFKVKVLKITTFSILGRGRGLEWMSNP